MIKMMSVLSFNRYGQDFLTGYDARINDYDLEFYAAQNNNTSKGYKQYFLIDMSKSNFNYTPFPFKHFKKDWDK